MKYGLVLEGGGMRGMYSAGVIDVMMENNINVDGAVGVSAGAVFGCNYKSKQIGRVIRYNTNYCKNPEFMSIRSLIKTGDIFGEKFCYHDIPDKLDPFDTDTYKSNPVEFYVTCTDVHTGKPVYHLCSTGDEEDIQWMRASASMPLVSNVVSVGGYDLLDGGVSDSIPVTWFQSIGYEKNIVVLTRPKGYRKKKNNMMPIVRLGMRKYPEIIKAMANRHEVYNKTLDELSRLEKEKKILIIQPSRQIDIKRTERDPEKLKALYNLGRGDAEKFLSAMREFLNKY